MVKNIFKYLSLAVFCFFGCLLMFNIIKDGYIPLGSFIGACIIFVVMVFLKKSLTPWRWLSVGIVMAVLFTIYPIFYTVYLSFTNMSGGHLVTKQQAIEKISNEKYVVDGEKYSWQAYKDGSKFLLLITDSEGKSFIASENESFENISLENNKFPEEIRGYKKLNRIETIKNIDAIGKTNYGSAGNTVQVLSMEEVAVTKAAYEYNSKEDIFTDVRTGMEYSPIRGTYTSKTGETLIPGFMVGIGFDNYTRFLGNSGYRKPLIQIFIWNVMFSLLSVLISFGIGLMIALLFEDLPHKRLIRSLLILPYPVPILVSIMVWRAMLNEQMGLFTNWIEALFGVAPQFFTSVTACRIALIIINVYLTYPYFYILTSGALKSIPGELFEAASIDGAGSFTMLRKITLPMLMRILAPMVISSFSFNFNNFTLIWGFNAGLPAMADTIVPMGYTDLLISFIYRLGFSTANAADYGFSAAITVLLFILVAIMVFFQSINTKAIKEN